MPTEIKIIMIGKQGVGKSSVLKKYNEGAFETLGTATVGMDIVCESFEHNGHEFILRLWDTAGQ